MTKIERIERFIKTSIKKRCKEGFQLIQGFFGYAKNKGCALTAAFPPTARSTTTERMRDKFKLSDEQLWSFIYGYDAPDISASFVQSKEYGRLGARIAKWARKMGYLQ